MPYNSSFTSMDFYFSPLVYLSHLSHLLKVYLSTGLPFKDNFHGLAYINKGGGGTLVLTRVFGFAPLIVCGRFSRLNKRVSHVIAILFMTPPFCTFIFR